MQRLPYQCSMYKKSWERNGPYKIGVTTPKLVKTISWWTKWFIYIKKNMKRTRPRLMTRIFVAIFFSGVWWVIEWFDDSVLNCLHQFISNQTSTQKPLLVYLRNKERSERVKNISPIFYLFICIYKFYSWYFLIKNVFTFKVYLKKNRHRNVSVIET